MGAGFCLLGPWPASAHQLDVHPQSHQVALGEPAPPPSTRASYQVNVPQCHLQHHQLLHNYFCLKFSPICYRQGVGGSRQRQEGGSLEGTREGVRLQLVWPRPGIGGAGGLLARGQGETQGLPRAPSGLSLKIRHGGAQGIYPPPLLPPQKPRKSWRNSCLT